MTPLAENRERARRQATLLAAALTPLIESLDVDFEQPAPPLNPGPLLARAWAVSDALTRLENERYTRGEIAARRGLERAALALRTTLKTYWRGRS